MLRLLLLLFKYCFSFHLYFLSFSADIQIWLNLILPLHLPYSWLAWCKLHQLRNIRNIYRNTIYSHTMRPLYFSKLFFVLWVRTYVMSVLRLFHVWVWVFFFIHNCYCVRMTGWDKDVDLKNHTQKNRLSGQVK